jgi:hypothetical protein
MLSKIRTAIRLSGQLWIKDKIGISQICVLELDALLSSVFAAYFDLSSYFSRQHFGLSRITSAASDVLANFSRLSIFIPLVKLFLAFVKFSSLDQSSKPTIIRTTQHIKTS